MERGVGCAGDSVPRFGSTTFCERERAMSRRNGQGTLG